MLLFFFQDPKSLTAGLPANLVSLMSKGGLGATKLTEVSKTPKIDNETPAQKQAAAKLALRKQLEKTLLQVRNLYFLNFPFVPNLLWPFC